MGAGGDSGSARLSLDQPQDHVAVGLAGAARSGEPVDDGRVEPYLALALGVGLSLEADAAQPAGACRRLP
ncbi:MAG: hypothetical protein ACLPPF_06565 [Rhodomicrobium sp.]